MKYATVLICLLLTACQAAAPADHGSSSENWAKFAMGYYKHPEPARVSEVIAQMAAEKQPWDKSHAIPVVVFFSYVFAENPSMRPVWKGQIASLDGPAHELLAKAMRASPESILAAVPASPIRNDALWTCFFATGKEQCIDELIDSLAYMGYPSSEHAYAIGGTAKWSLASNMQSNPLVREAIVRAAKNGSPEVRLQCQSILTMSVGAIRTQVVFMLKDSLKGSDVQDSVWTQGNHVTEHVEWRGAKLQLRFELWTHGPRDMRVAVFDESKKGDGTAVAGTILLIDGRFLAMHDIDSASGRSIDAIDMPILMWRLAMRLLNHAFPAGPPFSPATQQVTATEPLTNLKVATVSAVADYAAPWKLTVKVSRDSTGKLHYQLDLDFTDPKTRQAGIPIEITGTWEQLQPNPDTPADMSLEGWKLYSINQTWDKLESGNILVDYRGTPLAAKVRTVGDLRSLLDRPQ